MNRPRVVIDTGVFVSALLKPRSIPARAVQIAFLHATVLFSDDGVEELRRTLASSKLRSLIPAEVAAPLLAAIVRFPRQDIVEMVTACRDPKDDMFLSLAVGSDAECLVTGDRDLLVLHPFRGVAILPPSVFVERYAPPPPEKAP